MALPFLILLVASASAQIREESGGSPSNATNYQSGATLAVQERTGTITVGDELFTLPGIVPESDLKFSLSYRQSDAISAAASDTRYFGLPYGWYFNISFITPGDQYSTLLVDGSQQYVLDSGWRTTFTPAGSTDQINVSTGLLQYNQVDSNFKPDNGSVTVDGKSSEYVFTTVDGAHQYFSNTGLLISRVDRFGNSIDFYYNRTGAATSVKLKKIVDSWGNTITFSYCGEANLISCETGEVTVTLPDGRTVGWTAPDEARLTKVTDALGTVTVFDYESTGCASDAQMIRGMTAPAGGMVAAEYACLPVCTTASTSSCTADGNATTWPVVETLYECPSNTSGTACPDGGSDDYSTTTYSYGDSSDQRNYTGYPTYSPYDPTLSFADSLMSSNNTSFIYKVVISRNTASGTTSYVTINEYNFLHLMVEADVYVRALQPDTGRYALSLSKESSYCYQLTASNELDCDSNDADYQNLPANYQSAVRSGSCVYNVGSDVTTTEARRSLLTTEFDGFGNQVNQKTYHGTALTGTSHTCDRNERLSSAGLQLVLDEYTQYDTPTEVANGYLALGQGKYGLTTGAMSYAYLDADETGGAATVLMGASGEALLVTLTCSTLTSASDAAGAGAAVKLSTAGSMAASSDPPSEPGVVHYCNQSLPWDDTVAPPKTSSYGYDRHGRTTSKGIAWTEGYPSQEGIEGATETFSFELVEADPANEACGDGEQVMEITHTDQAGYKSVSQTCTLNGFLSSVTDADGRTMRVEHDANGMVTKTVQPNGVYSVNTYYFACPRAQFSNSRTCPILAKANTNCPYDESDNRSCSTTESYAGTDPDTGTLNQSYADGVMSVSVKDGFGRVLKTLDNVGGKVGSGFDQLQTKATSEYNALGLETTTTSQIGSSEPLVYSTNVSYGPKLRPQIVCEPRGVAHQYDHDDVRQETKWYVNGSGRESYLINDSQKLKQIASCGLVSGEAVAATASLANKLGVSTSGCPTIADTNAVDAVCAGPAYLSQFAVDGFGLVHSIVTSSGTSAENQDSLHTVAGVSTFSADRMKAAYSLVATPSSSAQLRGEQDLIASSTTRRDLLGQVMRSSVDISDGTSTAAASTDTFSFDNRSLMTKAQSNLSTELANTYTYTSTRQVETTKSYAGVTFYNYYNDVDQLVRTCFASESGGSEGERYVYDAITNQVISTTSYTNPDACSACDNDDCGDVDGDSETNTYTRFGSVESVTYSDGTRLEWAYDPYQRVSCFADALATRNGGSCPASPTEVGFTASPEQLLVTYKYWDDDDTYRRGLLESTCRGVYQSDGSFVTKCIDNDYYTSADIGGSSDPDLSSILGAYAGLMKTETYCLGGSCLDGTGSVIYQKTYLYDDHARVGSVTVLDPKSAVILRSEFAYDQYDNVVTERHSSDLDVSEESNFQVDYTYDGLLRLASEKKTDSGGNLLKETTYEWDARDNLIKKIETVPDEVARAKDSGSTRRTARDLKMLGR